MARRNPLHNLTDVGLDVLVAGLSTRFLPHRLLEEYKQDRVLFLEAAVAQIEEYYGTQSPAYMLSQWCLQVHHLLQNRAAQEEATDEMAICDLERMKALADFLGASDTSDDIRALRSQVPSRKTEATLFQSASGGFDQLPELLTAATSSFQDRLTRLAGAAFGPIPSSLNGQMQLLADRDFLTLHLIDGSQDRLEQCLILARMVGVIDTIHRLGVSSSLQAVSADAQRVQQLAVAVGIPNLRPRTGTFVPSLTAQTASEIAPEPETESEVIPQAEAVTSAPSATETSASEDSRHLVLSIEVPDQGTSPAAPAGPPDPSSSGGAEPPAGPPEGTSAADSSAEESESGPSQGSGVGRLLAGTVAVVLIVALLVILSMGNQGQEGDLNFLENLQSRLVGVNQPGEEAEPEDPAMVAAEIEPTVVPAAEPTRAAAEEPPTPTPELSPTVTPEPTPFPIPDNVAYTKSAVITYEWPHLASDVVAEMEAGLAVTLVRRVEVVPESGDVWLQLLDGSYVQDSFIGNIPTSLHWMDFNTLGMPEFGLEETEPPVEELTVAEPVVEESPVEESSGESVTTSEPQPEIVLRAGPGVQYEEKGRLPADAPLEPIGTNAQGDWIVLNTRYWVSVSRLPHLPDRLPVMTAPYANAEVNTREGPSAATDRVGVVPEGQTIVLVAQTEGSKPAGTWYKMDTGAWVFGYYISDAPLDLPQE